MATIQPYRCSSDAIFASSSSSISRESTCTCLCPWPTVGIVNISKNRPDERQLTKTRPVVSSNPPPPPPIDQSAGWKRQGGASALAIHTGDPGLFAAGQPVRPVTAASAGLCASCLFLEPSSYVAGDAVLSIGTTVLSSLLSKMVGLAGWPFTWSELTSHLGDNCTSDNIIS